MVLNRVNAQVKPVCNFLIGKPKYDQFNDIVLARRGDLIKLTRIIRVYLNDISLDELVYIQFDIEELFIDW